ncbi:uncharacterized protein TNCV_211891 [Trichonephila clavipes]|uniref:Uncharacterized protein n=1 Tax=Trichonephila clavipes TaxID=2585209 RepID=A0A8X6VJ15_TRICX|nr:uncharacterized protein TNCV_211891 [Trichonephila clavipes]
MLDILNYGTGGRTLVSRSLSENGFRSQYWLIVRSIPIIPRDFSKCDINKQPSMSRSRKHQKAWIVRRNDKSVREGYIRNGGKEVKLLKSALKAFQCNKRIVIGIVIETNSKRILLRGRIIERLECGRTKLEGFGNDSKMMVM